MENDKVIVIVSGVACLSMFIPYIAQSASQVYDIDTYSLWFKY